MSMTMMLLFCDNLDSLKLVILLFFKFDVELVVLW